MKGEERRVWIKERRHGRIKGIKQEQEQQEKKARKKE